METFWGIISLLLGIGFIGTVGLIFYMVVGMFLATRKATHEANTERERSRVELGSLDSEAIRSRLLNYGYFTDSLRATPTLQKFLSQVERKEEKALALEYSSEKKFMACFTKQSEKPAIVVVRSASTTITRYSICCES
jgi:magnesium-transporting ATPase (P-type)